MDSSKHKDEFPPQRFRHQARMETTSRLLASLINEGIVRATYIEGGNGRLTGLEIQSTNRASQDGSSRIVTGVREDVRRDPETMVVSFLYPDEILSPVIVYDASLPTNPRGMDPDPGVLFDYMRSWLEDGNENVRKQIVQELTNSASCQESWFIFSERHLPELEDAFMDWERSIIRGHLTHPARVPFHPMHRTCLAQPPLPTISGRDIYKLLTPEVIIISVLRKDVNIIGPFESTLLPFVNFLIFDPGLHSVERIILPCLARQLPAISQHFPSVSVLASHTFHAEAQASLRTVSLPNKSGLQFPYNLKFALACKITSALRTVTPWTACVGPEISDLFDKLLPPDMWFFREIAAVTGAQDDFDQAKHISVLIREDLEGRARDKGERIIPAAALAERGVHSDRCHAERVFGLDTVEKKRNWFQNYAHTLLSLTLRPLFKHGISLEAHGQNICARFSLTTKELIGFAYRDFGGLKLHMPTLRSQGYDITTSPTGSLILTDDIQECWELAWHTLFGSHLTQIMRALGLHVDGGWRLVRAALERVMEMEAVEGHEEDVAGALARKTALFEFLTAKKVPYKGFLKMKLEGLYRDVRTLLAI
ncbi:MAG: hypothetical protein Q9217_001713 [Psora testacea]